MIFSATVWLALGQLLINGYKALREAKKGLTSHHRINVQLGIDNINILVYTEEAKPNGTPYEQLPLPWE